MNWQTKPSVFSNQVNSAFSNQVNSAFSNQVNSSCNTSPFINTTSFPKNTITSNTSSFNTQTFTNNNNSNNADKKIKNLEIKLNELEKKIIEISDKNKNAKVTHYTPCSNCKSNTIVGMRYMCGNCNQSNLKFNLCDKCILYREHIHPNDHFFIMVHDSNLWGH